MWNRVEVAGQIRIHHFRVPLIHERMHRLHGGVLPQTELE